MKINTDGNTPMEGIVTFTMFPVYTLTSFLASLSGHSSSYIEFATECNRAGIFVMNSQYPRISD